LQENYNKIRREKFASVYITSTKTFDQIQDEVKKLN